MNSDVQGQPPPAVGDEKVPSTLESTQDGNDTAVQGTKAESEEPENYLHGFKLVTLLLCVCGCEFLVSLDTTIIATAIPSISRDFNTLTDVGWYGSAYFLTNCALQLLYGKFYSLFPAKVVLCTAMLIFEVGSIICAAAPNSIAFIVGRAIAGCGSAGTFSGALIAIIHTTEPEKRAAYSSIVVGMYAISSVVGPLIGGAFTSRVTWRWCFWLNVPCGAVAVLGLLVLLPLPRKGRKALSSTSWRQTLARFDPVGAVFFLGSIISLLLALQLGGSTYPYSDGRIIALFVVFGVTLLIFAALQIYGGANATVPIRIIRSRVMVAAMVYAFCIGAHFIILVYYLPIWFQAVRGRSALESGIDTLPIQISVTLFVVIGGVFVTATGHFIPLAWLAVVFCSIGAGLITTFQVDTSTGMWIGYQILYGVGGGLGYQQGITAAQAVNAKEDMEMGTAIIVFITNLSQTIFLSVAGNIQVNELLRRLAETVPDLNPKSVVDAGSTGIQSLVSASQYPLVLEAYNGGLVQVFRIALIMACLTALGAAGMGYLRAQKDESKKAKEEEAGNVSGSPETSAMDGKAS